MKRIPDRRGAVARLCVALSAVVLIAAAPRAGAESGQPDPAFGSGGRARLGFAGGLDGAGAAAQLADGRILVAGNNQYGRDREHMLARYNADGSRDTTFGDGGVAWHFLALAERHEPRAVAIRADGRIVVVGNALGGTFPNETRRLYVARFEADGAPDPTFGDGGVRYPDLGSSRFWGYSMFLHADARIVIAGTASYEGVPYMAIARLTGDGAPDTTFNALGYAVAGLYDSAGAGVGYLNGKYLLTGADYVYGNDSAIAVAQFNDNGTLDTSFGSGGTVVTWIGTEATGYAFAFQISTTQPTKIIVAGEANNGTSRRQFVVVRYQLDGSLDTTFDSDGYSVIDVSASHSGARAVRVLYSGSIPSRIIAAGVCQDSGDASREFAVVKLNLGGARDGTFDGDGIARTAIGANGSLPCAMFASSSRVTVVGTSYKTYSDGDVAAVRLLTTDGTLDAAFDGDGVMTDDRGTVWSWVRDLAVQDDGRIVLAGGLMRSGPDHRFAVARLLPDGTPDAGFDGDGLLEIDFGYEENSAEAVLVQPDGRIVFAGVAGASDGGDSDPGFLLTRRLPDGSADPSFGTNGVVVARDQLYCGATSLLRQPDGKLVAAGWLVISGNRCLAAARFEADGTIDTGFGPNGTGFWWAPVITIGGENPRPAAALQPDGGIVLVSEANGTFSLSTEVRLYRLTSGGLPDPTFGGNGKVSISLGSGRDVGRDVAVRPDGRIVVAGWTEDGAVTRAFVLRTLPDGTLDASFGAGGTALLDLGDPAGSSAAMSLALQVDGGIVIAGHGQLGGDTSFAAARLSPHGAVDAGFGDAGRVLLDFPGGGEDRAEALALDAQGNAILAGSSLGNLAVARLLNGPDASAVPGSATAAAFMLSPPSPNPTTGGAALALELPEDTRASATVYDVAGRVVRRLFGDRALMAGRHALAWDGRDQAGRQVAAGVYYVQVSTPRGGGVRKVVVVR